MGRVKDGGNSRRTVACQTPAALLLQSQWLELGMSTRLHVSEALERRIRQMLQRSEHISKIMEIRWELDAAGDKEQEAEIGG